MKRLLLLLPFLLLFGYPARAAITVVQRSTGTAAECATTNTCSTNTLTASTSGNAFIVDVFFNTVVGLTFSCNTGMSATGGTPTWAEATHRSGTSFNIYVCYALNIPASVTKLTATTSGGTPIATGIIAAEVSGLATSSAVDATLTGGTTGASTFSVGPTSSTTVAAEYAICFVSNNGGGSPVTGVGGGFTNRVTSQSNHMTFMDQTLSSTGTITCSGTWSGGAVVEGDIAIASFKSPAATVKRLRGAVVGQ